MTKSNQKLVKLVGVTAAVYVGFKYLLPLVVPFVFALVFAQILEPFVDWTYDKCRMPKRFMSILSLVLILTVFLAFFGIIIVASVHQLTDLVKNLPHYENAWCTTINSLCDRMDGSFGFCKGTSMDFVTSNFDKAQKDFNNNIMPVVTTCVKEIIIFLGKFGLGIFIFFIATVMILGAKKELRKEAKSTFLYQRVIYVIRKLKKTGFSYLKAQGIIIFFVACVCVAGLFLIGNRYALIFGIAIAAIDAFPVVGSGSILVPWAVFSILNGNSNQAAILFTVFAITFGIREILEPKLLGDCLGLQPLYMLVAIFAGIKLFGVSGIILGPIALITIREVMNGGRDEKGSCC